MKANSFIAEEESAAAAAAEGLGPVWGQAANELGQPRIEATASAVGAGGHQASQSEEGVHHLTTTLKHHSGVLTRRGRNP